MSSTSPPPPTSPSRRGRGRGRGRLDEFCFDNNNDDEDETDVDVTETTETGTVISFLGGQHPKSSTSSSSSSTSLSTTSLLILAVVAVSMMAITFTSGIFMGYYGFYKHFNTKMLSQLHDTSEDHNVTLEILASRLEEVLKERDSIQQESTSLSSHVDELRGRLESQSNLASAHRDLIVKHQSVMEQYRSYQQVSNQKLEQVQSQLSSSETALSFQEERCTSQIDDAAVALQQQRTATTTFTDYIQRRENTLCRQWFDHDGPYRVEFQVGIGSGIGGTGTSTSFVVEISKKARRLLPHTVFTFLTLVESTTYTNGRMSFVGFSNDQKVLEIGSSSEESTESTDMASYLTRLGYYPRDFATATDNSGVLKFLEKPVSSSWSSEEQDGPVVYDEDFLCDQYSFGFIQYGPSLKLFLGDDAEWGNDGSQSICFGKVVVDTTAEETATAAAALQQIKEYVVDQRTQLQIHSISYIPPDKYKIIPPTMDEEE